MGTNRLKNYNGVVKEEQNESMGISDTDLDYYIVGCQRKTDQQHCKSVIYG